MKPRERSTTLAYKALLYPPDHTPILLYYVIDVKKKPEGHSGFVQLQ